MTDIVFLIIGFADTIIKSFQYAWFLLIPVILVIIILIIKRKRMKKDTNCDENKLTKISKVVLVLSGFLLFTMCTSRVWGPNFYKYIIGFSINGKQIEIEEKLEKKYNRNFTFVEQDEIKIAAYAGDILGQNINGDYSTIYRFKDNDGVIAIVEYAKNYQSDYYESKRTKYEIEKSIYDYADEVNFNEQFYVFVIPKYESISNSVEKPSENFIEDKWNNKIEIQFIYTNSPEKSKDFFDKAISQMQLRKVINSGVYKYPRMVIEDEYKKIVNYYESDKVKGGIEGEDYEVLKFSK